MKKVLVFIVLIIPIVSFGFQSYYVYDLKTFRKVEFYTNWGKPQFIKAINSKDKFKGSYPHFIGADSALSDVIWKKIDSHIKTKTFHVKFDKFSQESVQQRAQMMGQAEKVMFEQLISRLTFERINFLIDEYHCQILSVFNNVLIFRVDYDVASSLDQYLRVREWGGFSEIYYLNLSSGEFLSEAIFKNELKPALRKLLKREINNLVGENIIEDISSPKFYGYPSLGQFVVIVDSFNGIYNVKNGGFQLSVPVSFSMIKKYLNPYGPFDADDFRVLDKETQIRNAFSNDYIRNSILNDEPTLHLLIDHNCKVPANKINIYCSIDCKDDRGDYSYLQQSIWSKKGTVQKIESFRYDGNTKKTKKHKYPSFKYSENKILSVSITNYLNGSFNFYEWDKRQNLTYTLMTHKYPKTFQKKITKYTYFNDTVYAVTWKIEMKKTENHSTILNSRISDLYIYKINNSGKVQKTTQLTRPTRFYSLHHNNDENDQRKIRYKTFNVYDKGLLIGKVSEDGKISTNYFYDSDSSLKKEIRMKETEITNEKIFSYDKNKRIVQLKIIQMRGDFNPPDCIPIYDYKYED